MPNVLRDLYIRAVALVDRGANQHAKIALAKRDGSAPSQTVTTGTGGLVTSLITDAPEGSMADDVAKALEVRVSEMEKALKAANEEVAKRDERLAKLEAEKRHATYIAKATALKNLPGVNPDDFATLLEKAERGMDDTEKVAFGKWLDQLNTVMAKSKVFESFGTKREGPTQGGALIELQDLAKTIAKDEKVSEQIGMAKAMERRPDLYQAYKTERDHAKGVVS